MSTTRALSASESPAAVGQPWPGALIEVTRVKFIERYGGGDHRLPVPVGAAAYCVVAPQAFAVR